MANFDILKVRHSFNAGDLITILPGIQHLYKTKNIKTVFMQRLSFPAFYYHGAEHPVKNEGEQVCMNEGMWNMMLPLLKSQEYIEDAFIWEGQSFGLDFDLSRDRKLIPMPNGSIHHWPWFLMPDLSCDLGIPWINCNTVANNSIIVNFTERYRNPHLSYYFLKDYDVKFVGTDKECDLFCKQNNLSLEYIQICDFKELAEVIKGAKLFIGNQSFCWHLADAMKVKRILEVCTAFPNTFPTGANGYAVIYQDAMELLVKENYEAKF